MCIGYRNSWVAIQHCHAHPTFSSTRSLEGPAPWQACPVSRHYQHMTQECSPMVRRKPHLLLHVDNLAHESQYLRMPEHLSLVPLLHKKSVHPLLHTLQQSPLLQKPHRFANHLFATYVIGAPIHHVPQIRHPSCINTYAASQRQTCSSKNTNPMQNNTGDYRKRAILKKTISDPAVKPLLQIDPHFPDTYTSARPTPSMPQHQKCG